jgi:hypothetical protein
MGHSQFRVRVATAETINTNEFADAEESKGLPRSPTSKQSLDFISPFSTL